MNNGMSTPAAVTLVVGLVSGGSALLWWFASRQERKTREVAVREGEAWNRRRARPAFDALETELGGPLPASYRALYADRRLVTGEDWLIGVPNPVDEESECYLAWFEPADRETLRSPPPTCEGQLPFANNGAGDAYLIDPRDADPEVRYYAHETGECASIGVRLSEFVAAGRRPVPEE